MRKNPDLCTLLKVLPRPLSTSYLTKTEPLLTCANHICDDKVAAKGIVASIQSTIDCVVTMTSNYVNLWLYLLVAYI